MSLAYLGSLSLAVALPGASAAALAGAAGINSALPDIAARLAALASFAPSPSAGFAADVTVGLSIVTSLQAAITAGLSPPSIGAQIAIIAALVAALEATVAGISANLTIVTDLLAVLQTAGVSGYAYAGRADGIGSAISAELAGGFPGGTGADAANALILATTTPATWGAMQSLFKTS